MHYDSLIVGNGSAGLALALLLAEAGHTVALLTRATSAAASPKLPRDIALNRASQQLLKHLEVWESLASSAHPYQAMRVYDGKRRELLHFKASELAEPNLGHIVCLHRLEQALLARVSLEPRIVQLSGEVKAVDITEETARLTIQDDRDILTAHEFSARRQALSNRSLRGVNEDCEGRGQQRRKFTCEEYIRAKLLIAADGARSSLRQLMQISSWQHDYNEYAIMARVTLEHPHQATAWQWFLTTGPLALLPLSDPRQVALVWSHTDGAKLYEQDDLTFKETLTRALPDWFGQIESLTERQLFPLRLHHAKNYVRPRFVMVGDAAHTMHPLAGQGANQAFLDVSCLVDLLKTAKSAGKDVGDYRMLRRYERARKSDNTWMLGAVSGLDTWFKTSFPGHALATRIGFGAVQRCKPLRHLFAKRALRGDKTKLRL